MKIVKRLAIIALVLIVVYFLGPSPSSPKLEKALPAVPSDAVLLEKYIANREGSHKLKADNEARIILVDSARQKTDFAVVYLHGFSATQEEGDPVHVNFARRFGCNLFLSRLEDHGVDTTEPLLTLTADRLWNSAKEAYAVGRQLGEKVILMATSTGASLALKLAAEYPEVHALILLSPNIAINDPNAWILNNPWGLQVANLIKGKYNTARDTTAIYAQYWNSKYRMEAAVELQELLETTMTRSTFERVKQPMLMLYYYKDEDNQDKVVKVSAMRKMFEQVSTPASLKREVALPNAGDHVIGSYIKSKDVESVEREAEKFAIEILKLQKKGN